MKRFVLYGSLISILAIACCLLGEVIFRTYFHFVINYDIEMWRYACLLKKGVEDRRSHIHRPSSQAKLMGVEVKINSDGFRGVEFHKEVRQDGECRILFLGDSLTFGWGVALEDRFSNRLEREYKAKSVKIGSKQCHSFKTYNLGVGNYNTVQSAAQLDHLKQQIQPDLVILGFFMNDLEPIRKEKLGFFQRNSYFLATLKILSMRFFALSNRGGSSFSDYYKNQFKNEKQWGDFQRALQSIQSWCNQHGSQFLFVFLPELHNLKNYPFQEEDQKVQSYLNQVGIESLNLLSAFSDVKDPMILWVAHDDAHPNSIANEIYAQKISSYLKGNRE